MDERLPDSTAPVEPTGDKKIKRWQKSMHRRLLSYSPAAIKYLYDVTLGKEQPDKDRQSAAVEMLRAYVQIIVQPNPATKKDGRVSKRTGPMFRAILHKPSKQAGEGRAPDYAGEGVGINITPTDSFTTSATASDATASIINGVGTMDELSDVSGSFVDVFEKSVGVG